MEPSDRNIDLGHDHAYRFVQWAPDRALNPQYDGIPDVEKYGLIIDHLRPGGELCSGFIRFDSKVSRHLEPNKPRWEVVSLEPLTLSPSLQCDCGDHGFIREGRWVPA